MILDEFGKPIRRGNTFVTPAWVTKGMAEMVNRQAEEMRVWELRMSLGSVTYEPEVGTTVNVKLPERFRK